MALSDSFTTSQVNDYGVNFSITCSWTATQSIQNNTSTISWTLKANTNGPGYVRGVYGIRLLIDNIYALNTTGKRGDYGDGITIRTGTTTVTHNDDGTKTLPISLVVQVGQSSSWTNYIVSGSKTTTLNTIARASQITLASTYQISSTSGNLPFTITPHANFYHRIIWTLNNNPTTVNYTSAISSATIKTDITNTLMLNKMSNILSGTLSITLYTYSDSSLSTLIGTQTATCEIAIDTNNIKPTSSLVSVTKSPSPTSDYAIAGYSTLNVTWSATASAGSSISNVRVEVRRVISGGSYEIIEILNETGTSGSTTTSTLPISADNYTIMIAIISTDSRSTSSGAAVSNGIVVYGYVPPVVTLNAYRTTTNTSTNEDGTGSFAYITFTRDVGVSINGWNTIQSTSCSYTGSKTGTASNGAHISLADNEAINVTLVVSDKLSSTSTSQYITTAFYPADFIDDGNGHVGAGFGTSAEADYLKTNLATKGVFLYGTCNTAGGTAAKVVNDITQFDSTYLVAGTTIFIKFTNANTVANPTLNVNGTGAIAIKRYGTTAPSTTRELSWSAGSVCNFVYDGTYWQMVGWKNTTYLVISDADIKSSTHQTGSLITGQRFSRGFNYYFPTAFTNALTKSAIYSVLGANTEKTVHLGGMSAYSTARNKLRINIPIPTGATISVAIDSSYTSWQIASSSANQTVTVSSVSVIDNDISSATIEVTLSSNALTSDRAYNFKNGQIKVTSS